MMHGEQEWLLRRGKNYLIGSSASGHNFRRNKFSDLPASWTSFKNKLDNLVTLNKYIETTKKN